MSKFAVLKIKIPYNWTKFDTSCWISDYFMRKNIKYENFEKFEKLILPCLQLFRLESKFFEIQNKKYGIHLFEDLQQTLSIHMIENENLISIESESYFTTKKINMNSTIQSKFGNSFYSY